MDCWKAAGGWWDHEPEEEGEGAVASERIDEARLPPDDPKEVLPALVDRSENVRSFPATTNADQ